MQMHLPGVPGYKVDVNLLLYFCIYSVDFHHCHCFIFGRK